MTAILSSLWLKILPWIAGAMALVGVYFKVRQDGKNAVRNEINEKALENVNEAKKTSNSVDTASDADVVKRVSKYYRD